VTQSQDLATGPGVRPISIRAWRNAVFAVFALTGIAFATWASRIPAVRVDLGLTTGGVAVLLFGIAAGSIIGLLIAPSVLARFGARRGMLLSVCGFALGLAVAGLGAGLLHSVVVTVLGLAFFGFSYSATDVLMNVEGAEAEKAIGKTVLPLMHAFFSVGTIAGAGLGAAASALGVPVFWNFLFMALVVVGSISVAIRSIPALEAGAGTAGSDSEPEPALSRGMRIRASLALWKDLRLLLIGLMMLGMAFTEGSANDWITLASVDGHGTTATTGALVYGTFVAAMTVARVCGGPLIDRHGRVVVLAAMAVVGIAGVALFILATAPVLVFVGAALWGIGGSLGFPVGMSAAADHPTEAARRVSIVAIFGYAAFLVGPPVLGVIAAHFGILNAFWVTVGLLVLSLLTSPAARPVTKGAAAAR
jgi:MFS family permease